MNSLYNFNDIYNVLGAGATTFGGIVSVVCFVIIIISWWKIFKKAGRAGFLSIIPFVNFWVFFKISTRNNILWFILSLIPATTLIGDIAGSFGLAKAFGKGFGFGLLLFFFPIIGLPILAFGQSEYEGIR